MAKRPPLVDLPIIANKMSFSQFSFTEPEIMSQKEKKRKHPFQCTENSKCDFSDNDEQVTCMMCNSVLNSLSLSERSAHVNRCLDETSGNKAIKTKSKKSPKKRLKDTDENDIASIFSPGSSSSLITATSRSKNAKRVNNEAGRTVVNLTRENSHQTTRLVTLSEGKEHIEHSSQRSLSEDLNNNFQGLTETIGFEFHKIPATSSQQKMTKDAINRLPVPASLNLVRNGNTGAHTNLNMSAEELELFHLRLQLGEYSAREAELRVKKALTLKNIKKVMKKAALKKATSALIFNSKKVEQKSLLENVSIVKVTEETKLKERIRLNNAMKMLFPAELDYFEDEEMSICGDRCEVEGEVEGEVVGVAMVDGIEMPTGPDSDSDSDSDSDRGGSRDNAVDAAVTVTVTDCKGAVNGALNESILKPTARIKTRAKSKSKIKSKLGVQQASVSALREGGRGGGRVRGGGGGMGKGFQSRFLRLVQTCPLWSLSLQMEEADVVRIGGRRVLDVDLLQDLHSEKKEKGIGNGEGKGSWAVCAAVGEREEGGEGGERDVSCCLSDTQQVQGLLRDSDILPLPMSLPLPLPLPLSGCTTHPASDLSPPCPTSSEVEVSRLTVESDTAAAVRLETETEEEAEIEKAVTGGGQGPCEVFASPLTLFSGGDGGVQGGKGTEGVGGSRGRQPSLTIPSLPLSSLPLSPLGGRGYEGRRALSEFSLREVVENLKQRLETVALILPVLLLLTAAPKQLCPPVSAADLDFDSSDLHRIRVFLLSCSVPPSHTVIAIPPSVPSPPPIFLDASVHHSQCSTGTQPLSLPLSLPLISAQLTALLIILADRQSHSATSSTQEGVLRSSHVDSATDVLGETRPSSESTGQDPRDCGGIVAEGRVSGLDTERFEMDAEAEQQITDTGRVIQGGEAEGEEECEVVGEGNLNKTADRNRDESDIKEVEGVKELEETVVRSKYGAPAATTTTVTATVIDIRQEARSRAGADRTFDLSLAIPPSPSYIHSHSYTSLPAAHVHLESRSQVQVQAPLPHSISTSSHPPRPSLSSSPATKIGSQLQLPNSQVHSALLLLSTPHTAPPINAHPTADTHPLLGPPTASVLPPNCDQDTAPPAITSTADREKKIAADVTASDAERGIKTVSDAVNGSTIGADKETETRSNFVNTDLCMTLYSTYGVMEGGSSTYKAANVLDLTSSQRSRSQSQSQSQSSSVVLQSVGSVFSTLPTQGAVSASLSFSSVLEAEEQEGQGNGNGNDNGKETYPDKILDAQSGSSPGDGDDGETERTFITGAGYYNGTRDGAADTIGGGGGGGGCLEVSFTQPSRERKREREGKIPPSPTDSTAQSQSHSNSKSHSQSAVGVDVDVDVESSDGFYGDEAYDFLPGDVSGCVLRYNGHTENKGHTRSEVGNTVSSGTTGSRKLSNILNAEDGRESSKNNQAAQFLDLSQKSSDMESVEVFKRKSSRVPEIGSAGSQESSRSRSPYSVSWEPSISQAGRTNIRGRPSKNEESPASADSPVLVTSSPMKGEYSYLEERLLSIKESSLQADSEADSRFNEKTRAVGTGAFAGAAGLSSTAFETHRRAAKRELSKAFSTRPLPSCAVLPLPSSYPSYFPPPAPISSSSSSSSSLSRRTEIVDLRHNADRDVDVDGNAGADAPSQKPSRESRNIQLDRERDRERKRGRGQGRRGGTEEESDREEDDDDVFEREEEYSDTRKKDNTRIEHTQDRGQKKGLERRTAGSTDDYDYDFQHEESEGRDRDRDKDKDKDRDSLRSGTVGVREENKKTSGKSSKKKSTDSETGNPSKSVQKDADPEHFYGSLEEKKSDESQKASTTNAASSTTFRTTSSTTSCTTSGAARKNPVISVDIFKSPIEPVFEIYSLPELQRLCGFYGLKKDTKTRLCSIFRTMWGKTKALMASTTTTSSSSSALPPTSSTSSLSTSSSSSSSSLHAPKTGGSRGKDGRTDSIDSRPLDDDDEDFSRHPSSTSSAALNTYEPRDKQPEKPTKSRKKKTVDDSTGKEDIPKVAKRQKKAGEREKVAQKSDISEKAKPKAREADRDIDVVCLLEDDDDDEKVDGLYDDSGCDLADSGREAGKSEVMQYLRGNIDLFMAVICFESLDLDSVHKRMTSDGIKIMKKNLLEILDSEHIFVSCGLEAKARKKETKKANPRSKERKFRQ